MTTEPLPSGRPWYWRYVEERPEGVYVVRTNIRADQVVKHFVANWGIPYYPNLSIAELRGCLSWWADKETVTSTELSTDAPIST